MTTGRPEQELLSNPRSDRVKAVARLSGRSARLRDGRFVVEGPQAVREAVALSAEHAEHAETLRAERRASGAGGSGTSNRRGGELPPGTLRELYVTAEAEQRFGDIVDAAARVGVFARPVTDEVFTAMLNDAGTLSPQGLLAVCTLINADFAELLAARPRLVAVLSQVRDPGNAGTVIRAADAAGADAVVLTDASVDVHNPKTVRSTAGSLFHLPVVTGIPLAEALSALRGAGLWLLAADGAGELDLDDLADDVEHGPAEPLPVAQDGPAGPPSLAGPVGWVFGNEAWGLPDADRALTDAVVRVPVHGRAESLNLATAATVCLYATARAQRTAQRTAQRRAARAEPADRSA
jgi:TrmH family RNA methyltransferase